MSPDRLSPSANPYDDSDSEEEELEEGDEKIAVDAETEANSDDDEEEEVEPELEDGAEEDDEEEDESLEKTGSPVVRGLDYGSDADSGKTVSSPSPYDFVVKENLEGKKKKKKKKRVAECEAVNEKNELKKSKKDKKKGEKENVVVSGDAVEGNVMAEDKVKRLSGQRIWGPEDELMIVKGMLDYKEKTGVDFNSNLDAFYQFIKVQLNAVVDKNQLVNKIRKLKEKFRDNAAKEGNGGELVFVKTHEAEVYEYSKKVWGGKAVARSKSKSKKEKEVVVPQQVMEVENVLALPVPDLESSKKEVNGNDSKSASRVLKAVKKSKVVHKMEFEEAADVDMKDFVISMPPMVGGLMFQNGLELVEKSKVDALNEKWTNYQMDAAELYVRRLDLIKEQTELVLDALKSANT